MTEQKTELVEFAQRTLVAVKRNEKVYVALKPICEALEIDYTRQYRVVTDNEVLKSVVATVATTGADGKTYQMVCLPLDYLNGWLFQIKASHFPESKRALIVRYQRECYRVLAEHFQAGRTEAAVASAVMERARRYELNDRRDILKRIGGIMSQYGISAAAVKRLAERAETILASSGGRPASDIPLDFWTEDGDEPEPELLNRHSARMLKE